MLKLRKWLLAFHRLNAMYATLPQGVTNFVVYKFGNLAQKEWQTMYDLAKMFLHCLNHWKLETPAARKQNAQGEEVQVYKINYTRYFKVVL